MNRLELIRLGPYRVFFPLGVLAGLVGVGHWALWSVGWLKESDSFLHATLQIQGFLTCFVFGFLMTALPRFLGASPASVFEWGAAWAAEFLFIVLTLEKHWQAAQTCFLAAIAVAAVFAARRFPRRTKKPPASFLLVGLGLAQAVAGSLLMMASGFGLKSYAVMETGRQMLQVGYVLCLVLGIAGYLAPFLMGYAGDPGSDPEAAPLRRANVWTTLFHGGVGALIAGTFVSERFYPRTSLWVRALAVLLHMGLFARIYRPMVRKETYVYFFRIACGMIPLGLIVQAGWPDHRLAGLHILFIGGYSLLVFSFALVVVLTHAAQASLLNTRLVPLWITGIAVLIAMGFRLLAEWDAWRYPTWIHAASGTWILAGAFWLTYVFPKLWRFPIEPPPVKITSESE
ncbi:MAG: hypothetical protein A2992_05530 [Elusimicrobia bacterium RIFCSPLOWO2_01_FULL_59_12]|nr:MAG: hypothetical protein A2992_05530 [Elusimicrobia bacterium RIFCSPLOWO2_01_FULL_59_12]